MFLPYLYLYRDSQYQYCKETGKNINILPILYDYDKKNGENDIKIWRVVLKLAR